MTRPKPAADLTDDLLVRQLRRRVKGDARAEELLDEVRNRLWLARADALVVRSRGRRISAALDARQADSARTREALERISTATRGLAEKLGVDLRPRLRVIEGDGARCAEGGAAR